ncbi:MAG: hypothetical protein KC503_22195 [Myxococcales bacterium]|nr:hypothetical protein [Myxococcales bacterium]
MTTLQTVLLFVSGYLVSRLLLRARSHERFVAWLVRRCAGHVSRIVLGLMLGAFALSTMAPNALVVLALLPVVGQLRAGAGDDAPDRYATLLAMALVYGANIGGVGSLLGSPANLYLLLNLGIFDIAGRESLHFVSWLAFGMPLAIGFLIACWLLLRLVERRAMREVVPARIEAPIVDALARSARRVGLAFLVFWGVFIALTMVGQLGSTRLWLSKAGGYTLSLTAADVVALVALLLLILKLFVPRRGAALLGLRDLVRDVPLRGVLLGIGVLVLLIVIAKSGLIGVLEGWLPALIPDGVGPLTTATLLSLVTIFATEVLSNTTTATLLFPVAVIVARRVGADPLLLMLGVSLASTCAFMTPLATPVNALAIAGIGRVSITVFMRVGLVTNALGGVLIGLWVSGPAAWVLR